VSEPLARRAARRLAEAGTLGLLALALATALDVLMRWLFAKPIPGFADVVGVAGAVLLAACMPHVLAVRGHIAVDVVGRSLGATARRRLDAFGAFVSTAFFAAMAWQYARYALDLKAAGEAMPVLRWPVWPWWAAVALAIAATALVGFATWRDAPAEDIA
jgi:TRAP-type C4-dicarboxylate transport system permease small subunit